MSPIPQISSQMIDQDVYILKSSQRTLLYAPLREKLLDLPFDEGYQKIQDFFNGRDDEELRSFLDEKGFLELPPEIPSPYPKTYEPINLTLSLTSNCNLRCKYCYARAGDTHEDLSWEKIETAIRLSVEASKKIDRESFKLVFHGGGEPLVKWDNLKKATELVKRLWPGKENFSVVTNATLLNDERAKWLKDNNFRVSVSLDGPKDVHDEQRIKSNGEGSFDECIMGMSHLYRHNVRFGIRATITTHNIKRLKELILIAKAFECGLKAEPLTITGRATEEMPGISYDEYYDYFNEAKDFADKIGVTFKSIFSYKMSTRINFCSGNGNIFCLLPGGHISTCTRTTRIQDELAETFIIGSIDDNNEFLYDKEKIDSLRARTPSSFTQCQNCFARWYCAGGCLHQRISNNDRMPAEHCNLMRAMLFNRLLTSLDD
jgi:uncharacterized protein